MLEVHAAPDASPALLDSCGLPSAFDDILDREALLRDVTVQRRRVRRKQALFRAGQPCRSLFLVHAGFFKTCVLSDDGREKVTGFHLRGSLLGIDSFDMPTYACDAVALDTGEVWELPLSQLRAGSRDLLPHVTAVLAAEIRRDWRWMLAVSTLNAEQRVIAFLLDLASRLQSLGFSAHHLLLRMTRADLGSFLALQLETVTRSLSHLASLGLIAVEGREIRIRDEHALKSMLTIA